MFQGGREKAALAICAFQAESAAGGQLETRAFFAGSQGGTVAPAGGNTCGPRFVRLDLKAPAVPRLGCTNKPLQIVLLKNQQKPISLTVRMAFFEGFFRTAVNP
jgi:hypothetical protein